jgi:prepilin-type N-terminal cleavage/methylation domain-containing protein
MKLEHKRHSRNKGFSLVEIIVVIAVMAILAAIAIPTFAHFINKANMASDIDFMNKLERAIIYAYATQDDKAELIAIEVTVNTRDKRIEKIIYTSKTEAGKEKRLPIDPKSDPDMLASLPIDWNYEFQALDSLNEDGIMDHENWKPYWSVHTKKAGNPYDKPLE